MCEEQREALEFCVQKSWDERFSRPAVSLYVSVKWAKHVVVVVVVAVSFDSLFLHILTLSLILLTELVNVSLPYITTLRTFLSFSSCNSLPLSLFPLFS